ncbi:DUF4126 domain-containing protein [Ruficoccus sp. ZRK36]|uniref:DUF4126 domain-containing protein n=1 Tax=Ruficoccus sp. ZRK36 TaxID=2866311 RepID=UPI001C73661C|nr:DUF4126 domain-containing protein [Ruficoccus sp. ZRK36]QYY36795.1 DUF4126 domain-containing protein [Ruficoccus sp. ZRK36]
MNEIEPGTLTGIIAVIAGIGLSAAAGFRVFIPMLVLSIAGRSGAIELGESFQWLSSWPALVGLTTATIAEVAAYYIPWVDNALDSISTPAALIAGTVISAAVLPDLNPGLKWTLAAIMGGAPAGVVQAGTVLTRGTSTATTGGIGNPVVSTVEAGSSLLTAILAIVIPVLIGIVVLCIVLWLGIKLIKRFRRTHPPRPRGLAA